ncbi:hypothetical protein SUNI508_11784 [Seiridium unicorne]|uniref:Secreted protein n=1 Tax=Seiridium unicorne TaxID=138068 RepID=A0ABR2UGG8_9PEZI
MTIATPGRVQAAPAVATTVGAELVMLVPVPEADDEDAVATPVEVVSDTEVATEVVVFSIVLLCEDSTAVSVVIGVEVADLRRTTRRRRIEPITNKGNSLILGPGHDTSPIGIGPRRIIQRARGIRLDEVGAVLVAVDIEVRARAIIAPRPLVQDVRLEDEVGGLASPIARIVCRGAEVAAFDFRVDEQGVLAGRVREDREVARFGERCSRATSRHETDDGDLTPHGVHCDSVTTE